MKNMRMSKSIIMIICVAFAMMLITGCSSKSTDTAKKEIPNLIGEWKQSNSDSEDSYQAATITADTIEIFWVSDNGDTKSLYWAGTFTAPTSSDEPYTWDSVNDRSKTDMALLASSDDTKTMKYEKGIISYETSALGTTTTIKLEKQK